MIYIDDKQSRDVHYVCAIRPVGKMLNNTATNLNSGAYLLFVPSFILRNASLIAQNTIHNAHNYIRNSKVGISKLN